MIEVLVTLVPLSGFFFDLARALIAYITGDLPEAVADMSEAAEALAHGELH